MINDYNNWLQEVLLLLLPLVRRTVRKLAERRTTTTSGGGRGCAGCVWCSFSWCVGVAWWTKLNKDIEGSVCLDWGRALIKTKLSLTPQ